MRVAGLIFALFVAAEGRPGVDESATTIDVEPSAVEEQTEGVADPNSHPVKYPYLTNLAQSQPPKNQFTTYSPQPADDASGVSGEAAGNEGSTASESPSHLRYYQTKQQDQPQHASDINLGLKEAIGLTPLPQPDTSASQFSKIVEMHRHGQVSYLPSEANVAKSRSNSGSSSYVMSSPETTSNITDGQQIWMVPAHKALGARNNNYCLKLLFDSKTPEGPLPHITGAILTPIGKIPTPGDAQDSQNLVFEVAPRNPELEASFRSVQQSVGQVASAQHS